MRQRSLKNQHRMLEVLLERFSAVDVTGMTAWERARAVHGRTAAGLAEGDIGSERERATRLASSAKSGSAADLSRTKASPSASPVAMPLFDIESEAA